MAKFRQVHVHMWKDSWFMKLSAERKLLFIYLFSNERAHTSGVYELPFQVMLWESGLEAEQVREGLAYFGDSGRAYYDEETGHLFVRNLMRYNGSNVLTNAKVRVNLQSYRQAEGASLQYWDMWQDVYPQVADRVFATCQKEQKKEKEEQREKEQPASAGGGASSVGLAPAGLEDAARLLEQARQEPANDLDRRRLEEMAETAEAHRLALGQGEAGADRAGTDWVCRAIEDANAARKPRVPLTLTFVESVLQRWLAEGFRARWGGDGADEFHDLESWGA